MKTPKALLMGSACLGLASYQALSSDGITGLASRAQHMIAPSFLPVGHAVAVTRLAENEEKAAEAASAAEPAAPALNAGVTSFYGGGEPDGGAAWAAEATMNTDASTVAADAAPAPAAAEAPAAEAAPAAAKAEAPAAAAAPASAALAGVTSYFGIAEAADSTHAWAAEATMNPDYSVAAAPAAAPAAAETAPVAEEAAPVSLGGQAVTSYFGEGQTPDAGQAWAAGATMNPVAAAAPAAEIAPARQAAVESCRDALNAQLLAGKLLFSNASWDILPGSYRTLDKVAKIAKDCDAGFVIEVGGHTDNTGKPPSNKTLSELRAKSVVDYLTNGGVDASKLKAVGYGQENPIAPNTTRDGRQLNRRIEFLVTSK